jgi:aspartyl/asparaginyl beta-hydroxylase (cupin superfamily)
METLAAIGQPHVAGRSPNAMFSVLKPHTRIPPHTGVANTRLTCHLPLIVPDGCRFRVGAQTREWRVGEAFVFDDTIEHEAMNDSDTPRIVMIFDIWHPGLRDGERDAVTRLMEAGGLDDGAPL